MPIPFFLVDAFTDRPFAGNPAVVCLLSEWKDDLWLQNVAAEMNQAAKTDSTFWLKWSLIRQGMLVEIEADAVVGE